MSYSTEELLYEYYDHIERDKVEQYKLEEESDKIEDDKLQQALDWAEQEEKKDLERLQKEGQNKPKEDVEDPMLNPENQKWVEEQLEKAKDQYGDEFGEDVNLDFSE